jgi:hypothetical protein
VAGPARTLRAMSEVAFSSAWEHVTRAKRGEIDARRRALGVHENTAFIFEELGLEKNLGWKSEPPR